MVMPDRRSPVKVFPKGTNSSLNNTVLNQSTILVTEGTKDDSVVVSPGKSVTSNTSHTATSEKFTLPGASMLAKMGEINVKDRIMIHVIDDNKG